MAFSLNMKYVFCVWKKPVRLSIAAIVDRVSCATWDVPQKSIMAQVVRREVLEKIQHWSSQELPASWDDRPEYHDVE